jgi:RNA polymerase sigma factor (sigma-70 family)
MSEPVVMVIDDDEGMRQSLLWLLKSVGLPALGYPSAEAFLAALDPDQPGCLVLDVRMPGMSGLELQEKLVAMGAALPVIIVTGHGDIPMAVRAMKAGAIDFLEKPFNNQQLLERISAALRTAAAAHSEQRRRRDLRDRLASLSPREREVALLVAAGKQNKVIAFELGISPKTVEIHRHNAMEKLQAASAAELGRMLEKIGEG